MSAHNGDKARFHRLRKAKLARRKARLEQRRINAPQQAESKEEPKRS
jgi:hypothetical protein